MYSQYQVYCVLNKTAQSPDTFLGQHMYNMQGCMGHPNRSSYISSFYEKEILYMYTTPIANVPRLHFSEVITNTYFQMQGSYAQKQQKEDMEPTRRILKWLVAVACAMIT